MRFTKLKTLLLSIGVGGALTVPAQAIDFQISGFIRQEVAVNYSLDTNPAVQHGNIYNEEAVERNIGLGLLPINTAPINGLVSGLGLNNITGPLANTLNGLVSAVNLSNNGAGGLNLVNALPLGQKFSRPVASRDNYLYLMATRVEVDIGVSITDWMTASFKIRGYGDWGLYNEFGSPSYFNNEQFFAHGNGRLEYASDNWMIDIPRAYLEIFSGPFQIRIGNQQIAWGEALFYRVFDLPNGLDLRRHLILDYAQEEYADERRSAPGIRTTYRFLEQFEVEAFVQMAAPTVFPGQNTPYGVIPDQFTVHQEENWDEVKDELNYGGRLTSQFGDLQVQVMGISRINPDGAFRWTKSGVNKDIPGIPGTGMILAESAYESSSTGVHSAHEWFWYAGWVRLDGNRGFDASITGPLSAPQLLLASPCNGDIDCVARQVDLFAALLGGVRGHIERKWFREQSYGLSMNYITTAGYGSFFDQVVIRGEVTYTPNRTFTPITLGQEFTERDEWVGALVFEKWHRFTQAFPATFMVLQYMFKSESDLFGRLLDGMGAGNFEGDFRDPGEGIENFHSVAFAFRQPIHPTLVWRFDFAVLADLQGGVLVQPGIRWKPSEEFTVEFNITHNWSNDKNKDVIGTIDYADEFALRATFQF